MIAALRIPIAACAAAAFVLLAANRVEAATSLAQARDLYASAAYGDALRMLDGLVQVKQAPEERQAIDLYRVLCLVALGRRADADLAIDAMIQRDPFYRPASDEVPPRLRAAFADARKKRLPAIVQQDYATAKGAFDRKEFAAAGESFSRVLKVLAQPEIAGEASRPPLSDLKTLAEGFRDLSAKASAPALAVRGRIYTAADRRVVAPTVLKQRVPPFRGRVSGPGEGLLEVVIGSTGEVESAHMAVPLNPQYDPQVMNAAKGWRYKPATLEGVPVMFKKQIKVTLVVPPGQH
jgi:hypothetical protein